MKGHDFGDQICQRHFECLFICQGVLFVRRCQGGWMDGCPHAEPSPGVLCFALAVPGSRRDHSLAEEDIAGC